MSVADAISFQSSQTRNDYIANGILNTSHIIESSTFFEYYATLRECLTDAKWRDRLDCDDDNWICNLTENIMPHFWDLDNGGRNQHRCPADLILPTAVAAVDNLRGGSGRHQSTDRG